jgi:hypothetical protein
MIYAGIVSIAKIFKERKKLTMKYEIGVPKFICPIQKTSGM